MNMPTKTAEDILGSYEDASDLQINNTAQSIENRRNMLEEAKANTKRAQERQRQFDRKNARSEVFRCGAKCLMPRSL